MPSLYFISMPEGSKALLQVLIMEAVSLRHLLWYSSESLSISFRTDLGTSLLHKTTSPLDYGKIQMEIKYAPKLNNHWPQWVFDISASSVNWMSISNFYFFFLLLNCFLNSLKSKYKSHTHQKVGISIMPLEREAFFPHVFHSHIVQRSPSETCSLPQ